MLSNLCQVKGWKPNVHWAGLKCFERCLRSGRLLAHTGLGERQKGQDWFCSVEGKR